MSPTDSIRTILVEWDPIGIAGIPGAEDEYDCLIPSLLGMLAGGSTVAGLESFLNEQLSHHFGLRPERTDQKTVAARLWQRFHDDHQG